MRVGGLEDVAEARRSPTLWVDVSSPDEATLRALAGDFGLHPLAIEDCLHDHQRPKLDVYESNVFLVWRIPVRHGRRLLTTELDVFLGKGWLLTSHKEPVGVLEGVCAEGVCAMDRGPEWLLHSILDRAVDEVFPIIDHIGDELDALGDELLDKAQRSHLEVLRDLRRLLVQLHKQVGPEHDALRELTREQAYVSEEAYRYFQDVEDHLFRLEDRIDTYREVAASVMDIYLSATSNRLNEVMKRLTVVTAVFMPGTLIGGIYGMNLQNWPSADSPHGFAFALGLMVVVTGSMLIWFKRSDWW